MSDHIKVPCIGSMVKADHPVTCLNPAEWFAVYEIKYEPDHNKFWVRGENTMWFNLNMITLRENSESNLSKKIRGHANYLRGHVGLTGSDAIWATFAANEIALAADFLEPKEGVDSIENWRWYEGTWGNSNIVRYDTLGDVVGIARIEDTSTRLNVIAKHNVTLDKVSIKDNDCICHGNWRNIVKETDHLIDRHFTNDKNERFRYFGLVHGADDYYYGLIRDDGKMCLASCVGNLESHGFKLIPTDERFAMDATYRDFAKKPTIIDQEKRNDMARIDSTILAVLGQKIGRGVKKEDKQIQELLLQINFDSTKKRANDIIDGKVEWVNDRKKQFDGNKP